MYSIPIMIQGLAPLNSGGGLRGCEQLSGHFLLAPSTILIAMVRARSIGARSRNSDELRQVVGIVDLSHRCRMAESAKTLGPGTQNKPVFFRRIHGQRIGIVSIR